MLWDVGLRVEPGRDLGKYAIVWREEFGQKGKLAVDYLEDPEMLGDFRGNTTWTGLYKGVRVVIAATNWGSAAATVTAEELGNLGVETFIRFGTAGSMQEEIELGEMIIAEGCVRADGASLEYLPPEYPAICDFEVTRALVDAAEQLGQPYRVGITRTHDAYFVETNDSIGMPGGASGERAMPHTRRRESRIQDFADAGVLVIDNELAGSIVPARMRGLKCGGLFCVTGNMIRDTEIFPDEAEPKVKDMMKTALEAFVLLDSREAE